MNELALFAGAGGGILGGILLGWQTICAVENDIYAARVLAERQNDGTLSPFPIWDNIKTFDGRPWRGLVDVVSAGFPCQGISNAGRRRGLSDRRSGLWHHVPRVVREVEPGIVWLENSTGLTVRGLDVILRDLAALGYNAEWGMFSAECAGAPHERERLFVLAYSNRVDGQAWVGFRAQLRQGSLLPQKDSSRPRANGEWMEAVSRHAGSNDGMAYGVDRTRAIGNGQVPAVVRLAWNILTERIGE